MPILFYKYTSPHCFIGLQVYNTIARAKVTLNSDASIHLQMHWLPSLYHRRLQPFALEGASGGERQKYGAN